jgi:hypothetical protein
MVTAPDGSELVLVSDMVNWEMRNDPEGYKIRSWNAQLFVIFFMAIITVAWLGIIYILFPSDGLIWITLALLGNFAWAALAIIYLKIKSIKKYTLEHPDKV